MKVLIVDDDALIRQLLALIARTAGHDVAEADSGEAALDLCADTLPDLVLMDVVMPGMGGLEAAKRIKARAGDRWLPVVFCSAQADVESLIEGLSAGGDDYLPKPINPQIVQAKLKNFAEVLALQAQNRAQTSELLSWREGHEAQHRLAQHILERLMHAPGLGDAALAWCSRPAETFNGDILCAMRTPGEVLHVMLADVSGHGLHAALIAMQLTRPFYEMTARGCGIGNIAEALNRQLHEVLPANYFVAATLVSLDVTEQVVRVWNGGNPGAIWLDGSGHAEVRWPSRHVPLGILPSEQFSPSTEVFCYTVPGEVVLVSDGVLEAEGEGGERYGQARLLAALAKAPRGERLDHLLHSLDGYLGRQLAADDISCAVVQAAVEKRMALRMPDQPASLGGASEWKAEYLWGAHELRGMDVVPLLMDTITRIDALHAHQSKVFVVLSELFNNAFDHGVLGLDSRLKDGEDGFEHYLDERAERMSRLAQGSISLRLHLQVVDGQARVLEISVQDSGAGFDHQKWLAREASLALSVHGRGILLVKTLCESLIYSGSGNYVVARIPLT